MFADDVYCRSKQQKGLFFFCFSFLVKTEGEYICLICFSTRKLVDAIT